MSTVKASLKRLAEIKESLMALWQSELPPRVKRMRERALKREADQVVLEEASEPITEGFCTRCRENPLVKDCNFCYPCIVYYLDVLPQWVRQGAITQSEADTWMAHLMKVLLDNKLIGIPEESDADAVEG